MVLYFKNREQARAFTKGKKNKPLDTGSTAPAGRRWYIGKPA